MRDSNGFGKIVAKRFVCGMLVGLGYALTCAPNTSACGEHHQQPQPKLTQWVAAENNWFLGANWNLGVPTSIDTARVDNGGIAVIRSCGAAAKVLQVGFSPFGVGAGEGAIDLYPGGRLSVGDAEYLGVDGIGDFYQYGGSHSVACGSLTLGKEADAAGSYFLMGGSLAVRSGTIVGQMGRGAFYQEAGIHRISCGCLTLAQETGSQGAYVLHGGLLSVTGDETVGLHGYAAFDQYGGTNTACGTLYIAKGADSSSAYALHNGILQVVGEVLGESGVAAFDQYGGSSVVSGSLSAGRTSSGSGACYLNGGLMVSGNESWGIDGLGVYYQDGGVHHVESTLAIGGSQSSQGVFEMQAGALSAKQVLVGTLGGVGILGIYGPDPVVTVEDTIALGWDAVISAEDGATIHMTDASGAFRNTSTNALNLEGLEYLYVVFEGGVSACGSRGSGCYGRDDGDEGCGSRGSGRRRCYGRDEGCGSRGSGCGGHDDSYRTKCSGRDDGDEGCGSRGSGCGRHSSSAWATFEVAGRDMGLGPDGFAVNFTLNGLLVGGVKAARVRLLDVSDNGNRINGKEVLYTHQVVVTHGSTLDLNGLKVYCDGSVDIQGTVLNGTIIH